MKNKEISALVILAGTLLTGCEAKTPLGTAYAGPLASQGLSPNIMVGFITPLHRGQNHNTNASLAGYPTGLQLEVMGFNGSADPEVLDIPYDGSCVSVNGECLITPKTP